MSSIGSWNGIPRVEPYIHWRQPGGGRNLLSDVESIWVTFNNNCAHPCPPFTVFLWFVQTLISHALVAVFKRLRLKAMVLQRSLRGTYLYTYSPSYVPKVADVNVKTDTETYLEDGEWWSLHVLASIVSANNRRGTAAWRCSLLTKTDKNRCANEKSTWSGDSECVCEAISNQRSIRRSAHLI